MQMLLYAEMFPGMSDEEFAALVANREEDTLKESIDAIEGNIINECNPFTNGTAAGITKCIIPAQDKSSIAIYDIFDAGFGPDAYPHETLTPLIRDAGEVFIWTDVFAEFERSMIQERVKAGLNRAKAQGKVLGRPKVTQKIEKAVLAARAEGTGKRKIAKQLGIGVSTVNRIISEAA